MGISSDFLIVFRFQIWVNNSVKRCHNHIQISFLYSELCNQVDCWIKNVLLTNQKWVKSSQAPFHTTWHVCIQFALGKPQGSHTSSAFVYTNRNPYETESLTQNQYTQYTQRCKQRNQRWTEIAVIFCVCDWIYATEWTECTQQLWMKMNIILRYDTKRWEHLTEMR